MGVSFLSFLHSGKIFRRPSLFAKEAASSLPKGYCAVYVGESQKKRFIIPVAYLNRPFFQELLSHAEEESDYNRPMGDLSIPCGDDIFIDLNSPQNKS